MTKSVLLFALSGLLIGGAWSLYKQRAPKLVTIATVVAAALALAAAFLWAI